MRFDTLTAEQLREGWTDVLDSAQFQHRNYQLLYRGKPAMALLSPYTYQAMCNDLDQDAGQVLETEAPKIDKPGMRSRSIDWRALDNGQRVSADPGSVRNQLGSARLYVDKRGGHLALTRWGECAAVLVPMTFVEEAQNKA